MTQTQAPPPSLISSLGAEEPGLAASPQAQSCLPSVLGDRKGQCHQCQDLPAPTWEICRQRGDSEQREFPYQQWHLHPNTSPNCEA